MELGCGLAVKVVRGRRYVYFWCYRNRTGRSRKFEEYIGPVGSHRTKERAVKALLNHQEKVREEVDRRIMSCRIAIAGMEGM